MSIKTFKLCLIALALTFTGVFVVLCVPPLLEGVDPLTAAASGFVNPFAAGYAIDAIITWFVLLVWVIFERGALQIKFGWTCVLLGIVPGVAVGLACYLMLRSFQLTERKIATQNS